MHDPKRKEEGIPTDRWEIASNHLVMTLSIDEGNLAAFIRQWKRLGRPGAIPGISLEATGNAHPVKVRRQMPHGMSIPNEEFIRETYSLAHEQIRKLRNDTDYMLKLLEAALLSKFPMYNNFFTILKGETIPAIQEPTPKKKGIFRDISLSSIRRMLGSRKNKPTTTDI